jgi:hypothetical protein
MSGISADRRRFYGLGLAALLLADLAGGAAAVVARASSPKAVPAGPPAHAAPPPAAPAPAPAAPPAAGPNAGAGPSDCGQGTATALAVLDQTPTGYVLRATVANNSDRTIELDHLAVQATYADGVRTFAGGAGLQIASGATDAAIALPGSASASAPLGYGVAGFAFHTAGRPDCAAR